MTRTIGQFAVCKRYGISPDELNRWIRFGKLPAPKRIGSTARRSWSLDDLLAWEQRGCPRFFDPV